MKNETIFEFIRFAIDDSQTVFGNPDDLDWKMLFDFSKKQTIAGVLYAGVERLPKEKRPPKKILMNWYMLAEKIKKRNVRLNEAVVQITSQFETDGFPNCVLKGQGNSLMYPIPELRTPGDIDLWPMAERKRIFDYVRKDFPHTEMLYHHLEYPKLKDVMTEVHFFPMFLNNPLYNSRFQKWIKAVTKEQCCNRVELEVGSFCRPTAEFNIIYQLAHIRHHFFDEGIGLRQIMDYYFLIKDEKVYEKRDELCELLQTFGLMRFTKAVMYVLKIIFGLDKRYLLTSPDPKIGQMLIDEIMITGNFGHQDSRFGNLKKSSRIKRLSTLLKKNLRFWQYFPGEVVFAFLFRIGQPIWRFRINLSYLKS
jgi:hypothetical protein